jgi:hypothetical protein
MKGHSMAKRDMGILLIRFMDGAEERFEYPRLPQDDVSLAARIEEALDAKHLLIEVEGKLIVYPFHSIKAVEISPAPEKLPRIVMKKARFAD